MQEAIEAYHKAHIDRDDGYSERTHSFLQQPVIDFAHEAMTLFRRAFAAVGWTARDLERARVLEIGCGWGQRLQQLQGFNIRPENLHGIDPLPEYVAEARTQAPNMNFAVMSGAELSYEGASFDCTFACVALSAMLDPTIIDRTLAEMCRVTRGFLLLIDNFDPSHTDSRNGTTYFRGVDPRRIECLRNEPSTASVTKIGSFWTTDSLPWRVYAALHRLRLGRFAYATAIGLWPRHSHGAYLVRMTPGTSTR